MKQEQLTDIERKWVDTVVQNGRNVYEERFDTMHRLRAMRLMRTKVSTVGPMQKYLGDSIHAPLSYRLVKNIVGKMSAERPHFTRVPRRPAENDAAFRLANSADPLLQTYEQQSRRALVRNAYDNLSADGVAVAKVRRMPWQGYPLPEEDESDAAYNKRVADFVLNAGDQPLRSHLVDPLNFMPSREEWDATYVVEQGKRSTLQLINTLGLKFGLNNRLESVPEGEPHPWRELPRGVPNYIPVEEIWTAEHCYLRVRGGNYMKFRNELGFIPYVWASGEGTALRDPMADSLSVLYPLAQVEPWLNMMLSTMAAWSVVGGTPILWTARQPMANAPIVAQIALSEIPLGKRIDLGTGGQIGFVSPPPVGREVIEFTRLLIEMVDRAGLAPVAEGQIGARTPGTAFSSAMEAATVNLKPLIHSAEGFLAEWVKLSWRFIEDMDTTVHITGLGFRKGRSGRGRDKQWGRYAIDPKDIDGYYDLHAELKGSSLQDLISQGMHAAFMKAHELWAEDRSMRFAGVEDPAAERREVMRDKARKLPIVFMKAVQDAIKESPDLQRMQADLSAQGVDIVQQIMATAYPGAEGEGGGGGTFNGAPQPRGQAAPGAGGRATGSSKQSGGTRQNKQPRNLRA